MIGIAVVDTSAESRNKLVERLSLYLRTHPSIAQLAPQISLKPLAPQEIKFQEEPHLCVVGEQLIGQSLSELVAIRKAMPNAHILVACTGGLKNLNIIEEIIRHGGDDVLTDEFSAADLFKKLLLIARTQKTSKSGTFILVDSGKGGVGVTSVAAALADALAVEGKKICLVDCNFETQDLTRFLNIRPVFNENLQMLLNQNRPVVEEFVLQSLTEVDTSLSSFSFLAPPSDSDALYDARSSQSRAFLSVLEYLDAQHDIIIADAGSLRGSLLRLLYRTADKVLFVLDNDASTLHASIEKLLKMRSLSGKDTEIRLLENKTIRQGLMSNLLRHEVCRASHLEEGSWIQDILPSCEKARKWPATGATPFGCAGKQYVNAMQNTALELLGKPTQESSKSFILRGVEVVFKKSERLRIGGKEEQKKLPAPQEPTNEPKNDLTEMVTGAKIFNS